MPPITRSMSAATEKANKPKPAATTKANTSKSTATKKTMIRASDQEEFVVSVWTKKDEIKDNAFSLFMILDYQKRFFQTHARTAAGMIPDEAINGGKLEWLNMSDDDKKKWFDFAKEKYEEGVSVFQIGMEANARH